MRVIKAKLATEPKRCICEECRAELEYEPDDVHIGWMGCEYVTCPECGEESMVGDKRKIKPTFPLTFRRTCKEDGAADLDDAKINEMVDFVVKALKENDEEYADAVTSCGTVLVFGYKNADEIEVCVTKDYWEDSISLD